MDGFIVFLLIMAVLTPLYWLPTIVAFKRGKANAKVILLLNFTFAWTIGGWFWLMVMAVSTSQVDALKSGLTVHNPRLTAAP